MNKSKQLCAITVVASLYLSGCASTSGSGGLVPSLSANQSADAVGAGSVGDTISLPDGNPTGASSADIISEYFAASNRRCRQVLPRGGQVVRIACEHRDGSWRWVRALTTSEVAEPLPALVTVGAAEPVSFVGESHIVLDDTLVSDDALIDNTSSYQQRVSVEPGETLWKFSQRTTGSGVHWQAIAELNDIDDARTVTSTMSLLVPPHLAIGQ